MFEGCGGCCLVLVLIPLLCCVVIGGVVYAVNTQAPEAPLSDDFRPKESEAQQFQAMLDQAQASARLGNGWFWMRFTERELASWMALEGQQFAEDNGHTFPFTDMQVGIDNGDFTFYGELDPGVIAFPVEVVLEPQVSPSGDFTFEVKSVDVSGIRAPNFVTEVVSDQFEDLLIQPLEDLPGSVIFYQSTLRADDGVFEVQGRVSG